MNDWVRTRLNKHSIKGTVTQDTTKSPIVEQAVDLIQSLSPTEQKSALDYLRYLVSQYGGNQSKQDISIPKRQSGTLKGEVIFADDFDELLDDFKDYMTSKSENLSNELDRQAIANQLIGCMAGIKIDDAWQTYHQHLDEKYAEYFD